ncbi:MAG: glycosyltransferase family 4 protein [Bryobacteraceae bacterium]
MKILQVLGGGAWGGGSVVVLAITRALLERGDEVWMACYDDQNASRFAEAGVRVVRPPLWFHPINPLDVVPFVYLAALCRREKFDLVATHTSKGGFLGRFAARLGGVPHIVHHAHGFSFNKVLSPRAHRFFVGLERLAARAGDHIISVNDEHRHMAIRLGVTRPERISTVHNGIEIGPLRTAEGRKLRRDLGFSDSDLLIGAVGRLAPQKGFIYLLQAMPAILKEAPAAHLVLAGEGPLEEELKEETRKTGVAGRIHFLGFRSDVPALLAAFDVFALPSLWEGLSISLIEALAAGKAIVATDIDGNREVVDHGKTALVVPPADVPALASALGLLLSDRPLAERLASSARRSAEVRFSVRRMVEQNLEVYDRVAAARRDGRRGAGVPWVKESGSGLPRLEEF